MADPVLHVTLGSPYACLAPGGASFELDGVLHSGGDRLEKAVAA